MMSKKKRDEKNRWRNHTVFFRISHEENDSIDIRAKLFGMTKQDYIISRCLQKDIVIMGCPKIYVALKQQLLTIYNELLRLSKLSETDELMFDSINLIVAMLDGFRQESVKETKYPDENNKNINNIKEGKNYENKTS